MIQLSRIDRPTACNRVSSRPPRKVMATGMSSSEMVKRLQCVPDTIVGLADQPGRIRLARSGPRIFVCSDVALTKDGWVLGVEATSIADGRLSIVKKCVFVACWCSLLALMMSVTGLRDSLSTEWSRRHSGTSGNIHLVDEMTKKGLRPTNHGLAYTQKPIRSVDLLMTDPLLLSTFLGTIAIIGAITLGTVRMIPPKWICFIGEVFCGVPSEIELKAIAKDFEGELLTALVNETLEG